MSSLQTVYQDVRSLDVSLIPYSIGFTDAATIEMDGRYAIFLDFDQFETMADYTAALAHEVGHCATGATHAVRSPYELVAQHENRANRWHYERYLPFSYLSDLMHQGYTEPWQLAEITGWPEQTIRAAMHYYTQCRGLNFNCPS